VSGVWGRNKKTSYLLFKYHPRERTGGISLKARRRKTTRKRNTTILFLIRLQGLHGGNVGLRRKMLKETFTLKITVSDYTGRVLGAVGA